MTLRALIPIFLLCHLFFAETCIKMNTENMQFFKKLDEMPETIRIKMEKEA